MCLFTGPYTLSIIVKNICSQISRQWPIFMTSMHRFALQIAKRHSPFWPRVPQQVPPGVVFSCNWNRSFYTVHQSWSRPFEQLLPNHDQSLSALWKKAINNRYRLSNMVQIKSFVIIDIITVTITVIITVTITVTVTVIVTITIVCSWYFCSFVIKLITT